MARLVTLRAPWRWAVPMSAGLVVCVIAIYVAFADTSVLSKPGEPPKAVEASR